MNEPLIKQIEHTKLEGRGILQLIVPDSVPMSLMEHWYDHIMKALDNIGLRGSWTPLFVRERDSLSAADDKTLMRSGLVRMDLLPQIIEEAIWKPDEKCVDPDTRDMKHIKEVVNMVIERENKKQ